MCGCVGVGVGVGVGGGRVELGDVAVYSTMYTTYTYSLHHSNPAVLRYVVAIARWPYSDTTYDTTYLPTYLPT